MAVKPLKFYLSDDAIGFLAQQKLTKPQERLLWRLMLESEYGGLVYAWKQAELARSFKMPLDVFYKAVAALVEANIVWKRHYGFRFNPDFVYMGKPKEAYIAALKRQSAEIQKAKDSGKLLDFQERKGAFKAQGVQPAQNVEER